MLKKMVLSTIPAFIAALALSSQPYKAAAQSDDGSHGEGKPESVCQHDCYTATEAQKADDHPQNWYAPFEKPDGMLVILGAITCGIIIWQTIQTRRAANAALLNAQAVINSERPWIVPKAAIVGGAFVVTGENRGRTPALILSSWGRYIFTDNPDGLPEPPEYTDGSQLVEYTFLTGDDPPFTAWQHPNLKHRFAPGKPEWVEGHLVYFYGRVRYADPSITNHPKTGVVYESRWCYQFIRPSIHAPDGHILKGGHYSYNVYT